MTWRVSFANQILLCDQPLTVHIHGPCRGFNIRHSKQVFPHAGFPQEISGVPPNSKLDLANDRCRHHSSSGAQELEGTSGTQILG